MNILEAINQKSFDSSYAKVAVNLLYTYNWHRDQYQELFKPLGIKMQHYNVLRILKGGRPNAMCPGDIKEVMLDKSPDLTRLIDKLVNMGLVERSTCPENRRKLDVFITQSGLDLIDEVMKKQKAMGIEKSSQLSKEEAEQLSDLLDKFRS